MDRLGDDPRQRALGALAVDRVEPEADAEQRAEDAEELVERGHALRREGEQVEEDRRGLRGRVGGVADRAGRRVHGREPGERHQDDEQQEPHRPDVIGELLAGDDAPAAAELVWSAARRSGRAWSRSPCDLRRRAARSSGGRSRRGRPIAAEVREAPAGGGRPRRAGGRARRGRRGRSSVLPSGRRA